MASLFGNPLYTLAQAAQVLQIDSKTLHRRMGRAGIEPVISPDDHRVRLLTEGQIEQLKGVLDRVARAPRSDTPLGGTVRVVKGLSARLAEVERMLAVETEARERLQHQLDAYLAAHVEKAERLEHELVWRMEEHQRTLGRIDALASAAGSRGGEGRLFPPFAGAGMAAAGQDDMAAGGGDS
jgi:hypothetical protein